MLRVRNPLRLRLVVLAWLSVVGLLTAASTIEEPGPSGASGTCRCVAPIAPSGAAGEQMVWTYPEIEIRHLSRDYAKLNLFTDGLTGNGVSAWSCLENPETGAYTVSLSTTSETSYFDLYAFLVAVDVPSRTAYSARYLGLETSRGNVRFGFEVPGGAEPQAWILVILFDEDLCYLFGPAECGSLGEVSFHHGGTARLIRE